MQQSPMLRQSQRAQSPLLAVIPNATARPRAATSEDDGKLDGDDDSGNVVTI
jgi:hypothetical protein